MIYHKHNGILFIVLFFSLVLVYFIGFLVFESYRNQEAWNLNWQCIHYTLDVKYDSALIQINKAIELKPNNPVYYAHRGLIYERKFENVANINVLLEKRFDLTQDDKKECIKSIREYKKALSLNPYDDIFYHNLGWLYLYLDNTDSAFFYINKAIEISPNTSIYHVSSGLLLESTGSLKLAFEEYKYALRLKPTILNSEFYKDLLSKYPRQTDSITKTVAIELKMLAESTNSPIFKSRLGIFYFYNGQIGKAKNILNETIKELPNINRPWYFLGKIFEYEQHDSLAYTYFKKSIFLDPRDYLVTLIMGDYYFHNKDTSQAIGFYTRSLYSIVNLQSDHAGKNWRMYHVNTLSNNIIPGDLLRYCSVHYPYKEVFSRLAKLYTQHNNYKISSYRQRDKLNRSEHYRKLTNITNTMKTPPISIIQ